MASPLTLADAELVARLPALVCAERGATLEVIEHLVEMERRRLYLSFATSSLYRYCIERLRYPEDAALKRHRVAKLALRLPQVLEELRKGTVHLTGLFLLSGHLTEDNADGLLSEARGKSRREIEVLIARWFPRPDVASSIEPTDGLGWPTGELARSLLSRTELTRAELTQAELTRAELSNLSKLQDARASATAHPITCSGAGGSRARIEPLSPSRYRIEFTADAELREKLERARGLLSHVLPTGDLAELFERALDALLEKETRRRFGAKRPGKSRKLREGSRHIPVEIQRAVWQRDGAQCTFTDAEGRRCGEERFLTFEHRHPFAHGGGSTLENLCLLCRSHNLESARRVFGQRTIETKIRARARLATNGTTGDREHPVNVASNEQQPAESLAAREPSSGMEAKVLLALCGMGFRRSDAIAAVGRARAREPSADLQQLLRQSLFLLVPAAS